MKIDFNKEKNENMFFFFFKKVSTQLKNITEKLLVSLKSIKLLFFLNENPTSSHSSIFFLLESIHSDEILNQQKKITDQYFP